MPEKPVQRIYAAIARPQAWRDVIDSIARTVGAAGATVIARDGDRITGVWTSEVLSRLDGDGCLRDWGSNRSFDALLKEAPHSGFSSTLDYYAPSDLEMVSAYTGFRRRNGLVGTVGTSLTLSDLTTLQLIFDGFPDHATARKSID